MTGDRVALAERSMERLADSHGDVTDAVIRSYYARFPRGRAEFEHHGLGLTRELEGRMVAECFYLLLQWVEDRAAAAIDQGTAIVHHNDTLGISAHHYLGLVDSALAQVLASVPAEAEDERNLWLAVRNDFAGFVESLRSEFLREDGGAALPGFALR